MRVRNRKLLAAALAGITAGIADARLGAAQESGAADEVRCYGINGCGAHASCAVKQDDLDAVRKLLGAEQYIERFGKSEVHGCGAHASCGAPSQILNWTTTSAEECTEQGGLRIEEKDGKKVAFEA